MFEPQEISALSASSMKRAPAAGMISLGKVNLTEFAYFGLGLNGIDSAGMPTGILVSAIGGQDEPLLGHGLGIESIVGACEIGFNRLPTRIMSEVPGAQH